MTTSSSLRRALACAIIAPVLLLGACEQKVTIVNFDKITTGMAQGQVEQVLGGKGEDQTAAGTSISYGGVATGTSSNEKTMVWKAKNGLTVTVIFKDGKVVQKSKLE